MEPLLRLERVNKSFGALHVLREVSLTVEPGSVTVLIGPSGSGKSTLLRCVNGLERMDSGRIEFMGGPLPSTDSGMRKVREHIGFVFQSFNLFPHLTALGNVCMALELVKKLPRTAAREQGRQILERVGLGQKVDAYPDQLSGGQQQRVSIARALAMEPRLMLFDEPTSALDPELTGEVLNVMLQLARSGMTMLVVSHEMGFVRKAASWVAFIHDGRILEEGLPDRIFTTPATEACRTFLQAIH
jgi:glutamate transport system ATP-binding protein